MACLGGWLVLFSGEFPVGGPSEIIASLVFLTFALAVGMVGATFIVAFYLFIFGVPVALLLGDRIRHPVALGVSLVDASAGAVFATTGSKLGLLGSGEFAPQAFALALCFALPAGYVFRRNIIVLREQLEYT